MAVTDWTDNAYPLGRKNRSPQPQTSQQPGAVLPPPVPRASVLSFWASTSVGAAQCISMPSRRLVGPAFIDYIVPRWANQNGSDAWRLTVDSNDALIRAAVGAFAQELGDPIFETAQAGATGNHLPSVLIGVPGTATAGVFSQFFKIGKVIDRPEFFLKATWYNGGASAAIGSCVVRVVEGISPELLPEFVLSG